MLRVAVAESIMEELKRYVGFGPDDMVALRALHPHALPHFEQIAEVFYERILSHPEARQVLEGGESRVGQLKRTLVQWMDGALNGPWDEAYFERRCRIGRVHVKIGLPQHYMFGAMNVLRRELESLADERAAQAPRTRKAIGRLLDIELAIMLHTYREDLEAQRMAAVGTLTAGLSHEIRNPLNAAALQLAVLERRVRKIPEQQQAGALEPLILVRDEIRRLDHLLEDLLQYARPRQLEQKPVDMAQLVEQACQLLASDADSRGIQMSVAIDEGVIARGDSVRLREVVINLVLNALDASRRGGEVRIRGTRKGPAEVELSVEDDGAGIAPEQREKVFQPFFTTKAQGTGLGLAIVHSVVTQHHGSIRLEAAEKGGAAFRIRLPGA
jgi:two-component system, NtrC family, sensor histidine kinase HydH